MSLYCCQNNCLVQFNHLPLHVWTTFEPNFWPPLPGQLDDHLPKPAVEALGHMGIHETKWTSLVPSSRYPEIFWTFERISAESNPIKNHSAQCAGSILGPLWFQNLTQTLNILHAGVTAKGVSDVEIKNHSAQCAGSISGPLWFQNATQKFNI